MNFGTPRGAYPGNFNSGSSGRFRGQYQQSPPPNMGSSGRRDKAVTFMPNDIKIPKPPKQPDKPLPAYMRYSRKEKDMIQEVNVKVQVWETVKSQHPDMKMWDVGKVIGEQWRNLPEDERQGFFAEYEVEKAEYQEAMKNYHNSTAYREWMKAKEKAQNAIQEQQMMEKMLGAGIPKEEPRFQLQQIEDDDEEAEFAEKHVAASRFQRNHRLVADIFSEATVPDIKTIVTKPRLDNLKKQVQSLMQHQEKGTSQDVGVRNQRKLESEIEEMEEKFSAKKRKILDKSEAFEVKMKELAERELPPPPPVVDTPEERSPENRDIADEKKGDEEKVENNEKDEKGEKDEKMETDSEPAVNPDPIPKPDPTSKPNPTPKPVEDEAVASTKNDDSTKSDNQSESVSPATTSPVNEGVTQSNDEEKAKSPVSDDTKNTITTPAENEQNKETPTEESNKVES